MSPTVPAVGDLATAAWADEVAQDVVDLAGGGTVSIIFGPGGVLSTPTAGTATWVTVGNITVPTWATKAYATWSLYGVISSATEPNVSMQLKIGSAGGGAVRVYGHGAAAGRFHTTLNELILGLSTGSQSVTISSTWTSGANVFSLDVGSRVSAKFDFQP
jgi:hypothetical protein